MPWSFWDHAATKLTLCVRARRNRAFEVIELKQFGPNRETRAPGPKRTALRQGCAASPKKANLSGLEKTIELWGPLRLWQLQNHIQCTFQGAINTKLTLAKRSKLQFPDDLTRADR